MTRPDSGLMSNTFPPPVPLRVCAQCAARDCAAGGQPWWRRPHQLPGVLVCPEHAAVLRETGVERARTQGRSAFVPLTVDLTRGAPEVEIGSARRDVLQRVARASTEVLVAELQPLDIGVLQGRLRQILGSYRWERCLACSTRRASPRRSAGTPRSRRCCSRPGSRARKGGFTVALNRLLYNAALPKHPLFVVLVLEFAGASVADLLSPDRVDPTPSAAPPRRGKDSGAAVGSARYPSRAATPVRQPGVRPTRRAARFGPPARGRRPDRSRAGDLPGCPACGCQYRLGSGAARANRPRANRPNVGRGVGRSAWDARCQLAERRRPVQHLAPGREAPCTQAGRLAAGMA